MGLAAVQLLWPPQSDCSLKEHICEYLHLVNSMHFGDNALIAFHFTVWEVEEDLHLTAPEAVPESAPLTWELFHSLSHSSPLSWPLYQSPMSAHMAAMDPQPKALSIPEPTSTCSSMVLWFTLYRDFWLSVSTLALWSSGSTLILHRFTSFTLDASSAAWPWPTLPHPDGYYHLLPP